MEHRYASDAQPRLVRHQTALVITKQDNSFQCLSIISMSKDIRALVRPFILPSIWRFLASIANYIAVFAMPGRGRGNLFLNDNVESVIHLATLRTPIFFRRNTFHTGAIIQNCIRREYDRHLPGSFIPETILDAGGYIGDLTAWWASRWPNAQVCTIEPDVRNLEFALKNLAPFSPRVRVVSGALWNKSGSLHISGSETSSSVAHLGDDAGSVVAYTVPDIMRLCGWSNIDLLKLDIEGSEYSVLDDSSESWLCMVKRIVIEYHACGDQAAVERRLSQAGFKGRRFRSLITYVRNDCL